MRSLMMLMRKENSLIVQINTKAKRYKDSKNSGELQNWTENYDIRNIQNRELQIKLPNNEWSEKIIT